MIAPIKGSWWLDDGRDSGVWPCEVLNQNIFGVKVRQTHPEGPYYGEELYVPHDRVYDSGFNRVTVAARAAR